VILRCTRKLLDAIKPAQLANDAPGAEDWYANLLWLDGRKCLLLTHTATLFTVFEPDIRVAALRDTGRLVTGAIARELAREELPADTFGSLDPVEVALAKTADRSVLAHMTAMALPESADLTVRRELEPTHGARTKGDARAASRLLAGLGAATLARVPSKKAEFPQAQRRPVGSGGGCWRRVGRARAQT